MLSVALDSDKQGFVSVNAVGPSCGQHIILFLNFYIHFYLFFTA